MASSNSARHTDDDQLQSDEAAAQKLWRMIGTRVTAYQSISACREAIASIDGLKNAVNSVDEANEANQYLICTLLDLIGRSCLSMSYFSGLCI